MKIKLIFLILATFLIFAFLPNSAIALSGRNLTIDSSIILNKGYGRLSDKKK